MIPRIQQNIVDRPPRRSLQASSKSMAFDRRASLIHSCFLDPKETARVEGEWHSSSTRSIPRLRVSELWWLTIVALVRSFNLLSSGNT